MYRSDYIKEHNIRHNETPGASYQDNGFWFQSLMYCNRIYLLNEAFYMYRKDNPNSSIYSKEKVHAFSDEYVFIREKIADYDGDKKSLINICAFFNLHQNLDSLLRVDRTHIMELLDIIASDLKQYSKNDNYVVCNMDLAQMQKILQCIVQPQLVYKKVIIAQELYQSQVSLLQRYQTYILYGAGQYAEEIWQLLIDRYIIRDKEIYCGVTEPSENQYFNGVKVQRIETLCKENNNALVIVCSTKKGSNREQMLELLHKIQCAHFVDADYFFPQDIWRVDEYMPETSKMNDSTFQA